MSAYAVSPTSGSRNKSGLALGLAIGLHGLVAAVLLWGFQWNNPAPKPIQLELWSAAAPIQSAPSTRHTPVPVEQTPTVIEEIQPAEINRKKPVEPQPEKTKPPVEKEPEKPKTKPVDNKPTKPGKTTAPQQTQQMDDLIAALGKAEAAPQGANRSQLIGDYQKNLSQLILPRVIYSGDQSNNPTAEFRITVLSSMTISTVDLVKSSGNPQWDSAAEKAILMNKKLPALPEGLPYSNELRTMRIKLCPKSCS